MNKNIPRILAMTAFAAAVSLASSASAFAQSMPEPAATKNKPALALAHAAQPIHKKHHRRVHAKKSVEETTEDRIRYLHTVLQITPAQEDEWAKVAAVMRENADDITKLAQQRAEKRDMTAVDDLKSYAEFSGAHEEGAKKLIPVFKSLYEDMSASQQKVADMVFRDHEHGGVGRSKT